MPKFNEGDKVMYLGSEATISKVKMGGYLIDFKRSKRQFVYESDLILIQSVEDDRGKNRTFDDQDYYDPES